jgi:hypothetical protein
MALTDASSGQSNGLDAAVKLALYAKMLLIEQAAPN